MDLAAFPGMSAVELLLALVAFFGMSSVETLVAFGASGAMRVTSSSRGHLGEWLTMSEMASMALNDLWSKCGASPLGTKMAGAGSFY